MCVLRSEDLEKQLAVQKEKIHHLDDMLKCHQRKVRHMIEQVTTHTQYTCTHTHIHMHTHSQELAYRVPEAINGPLDCQEST